MKKSCIEINIMPFLACLSHYLNVHYPCLFFYNMTTFRVKNTSSIGEKKRESLGDENDKNL